MIAAALLLAAAVPTVDVATVVGRFQTGAKLGPRRKGPFCGPAGSLKWKRDLGEGDLNLLQPRIRRALAGAGYPTLDGTDELFARASPSPATRLVAVEIITIEASLCDSHYAIPGIFESPGLTRWHGDLALTARWSIYDSATRTVIQTVGTTGQAARPRGDPAFGATLIGEALAESAAAMLQTPEAKAALR